MEEDIINFVLRTFRTFALERLSAMAEEQGKEIDDSDPFSSLNMCEEEKAALMDELNQQMAEVVAKKGIPRMTFNQIITLVELSSEQGGIPSSGKDICQWFKEVEAYMRHTMPKDHSRYRLHLQVIDNTHTQIFSR